MKTTALPPLPRPRVLAGHFVHGPSDPSDYDLYAAEQVQQAQADARNAVIDQIVEIIRNTQAGAKRLATADFILTLKIDAAPTGPAQPDGEKQ